MSIIPRARQLISVAAAFTGLIAVSSSTLALFCVEHIDGVPTPVVASVLEPSPTHADGQRDVALTVRLATFAPDWTPHGAARDVSR